MCPDCRRLCVSAPADASRAECSACGARDVTENWSVYRRVVGGTMFWTRLISRDCGACGRVSLPACELGWFQMAVARHLARVGARSPDELALMRIALGLSCADLARELGISPEITAQWETGQSPASPEALAAFHRLVIDRSAKCPLVPIGLRIVRG